MGMKVFASANTFAAVTPSDTTLLKCKALWVGTGGDLIVSNAITGAGVTLANVADGAIVPIELKDGRVLAATSASNIVALNW